MGALHSIYNLNRLRRRLYWSPEKLNALRNRKLADLLEYCYRRIPYYHQQFVKIGAQPRDFKELDDLTRFPILEKETIRDHANEFLDPDADRSAWMPYRSSGSTGIPLELWYHPAERLRMGFTVTRELLHNGLKPHYSMVNITEPRHSAPKHRWYHRLGFMNEQFLSVYERSDINLERLIAIRPQVIIGFPSSLMVIGQEMNRNATKPLKPRLLFTLAEVLTAQDREILHRQWGVEPIDLYGANEVGHIAFQCRFRHGYHVNVDSLHIEILSGDKPVTVGQRGEVVVTNFDLRVMPIIRYRIGDVGQWSEGSCSYCGCRFSMLAEISGRSDGFLTGVNGRTYSALEISLLLKSVKGIARYRIIQGSRDALTVDWIPVNQESNPTEDICLRLKERLGNAIRIEARRVDKIAPETSGKIRTVISRLPHPFWLEESDL